MKIAAVNACIDGVKRNLGEALLTTTIVGLQDGQAIARYNTTPKLEAIVAQITTFYQNVLKNTEIRKLGEYYFIQLDNNTAGVFIVFDNYVWSVIFDTTKTTMGMMLNVYMPDMIAEFETAM
ncbi:MAG: hypothetical protein HUJ69_03955 [Lachnospiraceae bacterium]|nr:hypothetical protein [Lachnospiraceae bacterium]